MLRAADVRLVEGSGGYVRHRGRGGQAVVVVFGGRSELRVNGKKFVLESRRRPEPEVIAGVAVRRVRGRFRGWGIRQWRRQMRPGCYQD